MQVGDAEGAPVATVDWGLGVSWGNGEGMGKGSWRGHGQTTKTNLWVARREL